MTKSLKHKFVSAIADGTDATLVRPTSNWNDDHNFLWGYRTYTGTTADNIVLGDHLTYVVYNTTTSIVVGINAATGMVAGWFCKVVNNNTGVITLTPSVGTINGVANIPLYQGDSAEIVYVGSNAFYAAVTRAPVSARYGGKLTRSSATLLAFGPTEGKWLRINGRDYSVVGGIAGLGNTGVRVNNVAGQNLAANTLYTIYATLVGGTVTADFRTDAPSSHRPCQNTPGNEGVEVLFISGNEYPGESLIGLCYTDGSAQFQDSPTSRFVRSWFNEGHGLVLTTQINGYAYAGGSWTSIQSTILLFCTWAGEPVNVSCFGVHNNSAVYPATDYLAVTVNGTISVASYQSESAQNYAMPGTIPLAVPFGTVDAANSVYIQAQVPTGTGTFYLGVSVLVG